MMYLANLGVTDLM